MQEQPERESFDDKLLKTKEVAKILDCSPDDVYPLIMRGELEARKVGRLWKFRHEAVLSYKERMNRGADRTKTP